ncbi:hypothetical protein E2I00_011975 [Balaenoptera physalus]|uniref:Retinoic acid-induced protein 2 n=1 Tax=Balaenoptera physalus TaxID=9770 RepID=A0A643C450_BALPH|nr:hypothetical protein E2I00_011975 [Balaenoptera physalus]
MDDLQSQNLSMDMTDSSPALTNNRLENGMAQLITTEAWNINSTDLVKKALVTVPAPSILNPPAESQSGMALKVEGSSAPELNPNGNATYVMTTQGPVQLPVVLEQHVFQHLNSPLVLPQEAPCSSSAIHNNLFPGAEDPEAQPQLLDLRIPSQPQEPTLPFEALGRHTVIKMGSENEALDLSMKSVPWLKAGEVSPPMCQEDAALDLSLAAHRKSEPPPETLYDSSGSVDSPGHTVMEKLPSGTEVPFAPATPHEASAVMDSHMGSSDTAEPPSQPSGEVKAENNIEIVSESQAAKVIVSVEDTVPTIFCGKIKGLSGVSTKNFSFKREDSMLQGYDINSPGEESMGNTEPLRKPVKNRSIKLKKVNSQEIHMLPIKKQRLATFFPRK